MKSFLKRVPWRYVVPVGLILLFYVGTIFAYNFAVNLASWYSLDATSSVVIDSGANVNLSGTNAMTLAASNSVNFVSAFSTTTTANNVTLTGTGNMTIVEPFQGAAYKEVVVGLTNFTSTANTTFTYPTAFTILPTLQGTNSNYGWTSTGGSVTSGTCTLSSGMPPRSTPA